MNKYKVASVLCVIAGATAMAFASWTSPDGTVHQNDSTCSSESNGRYCRLCCLAFNSDPTSSDYKNCIAGCPNSEPVDPIDGE